MTTISDTILSLSSATEISSSSSTESSEEIMGKEDFLTLLVAQLQNQDPLDPEDTSEFTSQLTQYSSLEQLMNLNDSFDAFTNSSQTLAQSDVMDLIGKDVVTEQSEFEFAGKPLEIGYQLDEAATSITIIIQDESGNSISTLTPSELGAGSHFIEWDGLDSNGNISADGQYTSKVEATDGSGEGIDITSLIRSTVVGIEMDSIGTTDVITTAGTVSPTSISAVYDASTNAVGSSETVEDLLQESSEQES